MRLTEDMLARELARHAEHCALCAGNEQCDGPDRIEAAFWNEVDNRIDDDKIRRAERGR